METLCALPGCPDCHPIWGNFFMACRAIHIEYPRGRFLQGQDRTSIGLIFDFKTNNFVEVEFVAFEFW